ncbi:MAG: hypothetical protein ACTSO3_00895 [Candidatus Heimdallarchaeaceae archaeon]
MIKRTELITVLNNLKCALTTNEILEQSNAFVFQDGTICSFNGEIFASAKYDIGIEKDFAISGSDLIKLLENYPDENIIITLKNKELLIKGKRKRAGITIFEEILLPYKEVPEMGKFKKIKKGFFHNILQCARICGRDHTNPKTTHVHLSSDLIEATDRYRIFRIDTETGFNKDAMIPADSIISIGNKEIVKAGIKDNWLHMISSEKVRYSIRCAEMEYFEDGMIDSIIKVNKKSIGRFPKGIIQTLERSQVMRGNDGLGVAHITLKKGIVIIKTSKENGWYEEKSPARYSGKPISFIVSVDFLKDILSKTLNIIFGESKIKIEKDNFHFVIVIEKAS